MRLEKNAIIISGKGGQMSSEDQQQGITLRFNVKHIRTASFIAMMLVLYMSFYNNSFNVVDDWRFDTYKNTDNSYVIGQLIRNEHFGFSPLLIYSDGIWSHMHYQREQFIKNIYFSGNMPKKWEDWKHWKYYSTLGIQSFVYSPIDFALKGLGVMPKARLKYMKYMTALALAITLSVLVMWIAAEFGASAALIAFAAVFYSKYLTIYGSNIYSMIFLWFLPLLWCWRYYISRPPPEGRSLTLFCAGFFALTFMHMSQHLSYTIPTLVGSGAIIVYGLSKNGFLSQKIFQDILRHGGLLVASSLAAFITSVIITSIFIYTILNKSVAWILDHWNGKFLTRVWSKTKANHPDQGWSGAYESAFLDNFKLYFNIDIWGALSAFPIFIFLILSGLAFLLITAFQNKNSHARFWQNPLWQKSAALYLFGILSFLAGVMQFAMFKNHAYANTHIGPIVWSVPGLIIFPVVIWAMAQHIKARKMAASAATACLIAVPALTFPLNSSIYMDKFTEVEMLMHRDKFLAPLKKIESGEFKPLISSRFNVYLDQDRRSLVYVTHKCGLKERSDRFFIHTFPYDIDVLRKKNITSEAEAYNFSLSGPFIAIIDDRPHEQPVGSKYFGMRTCIYFWRLPSYKVKKIRTGQYIERENAPPEQRYHNFWEGEADVE